VVIYLYHIDNALPEAVLQISSLGEAGDHQGQPALHYAAQETKRELQRRSHPFFIVSRLPHNTSGFLIHTPTAVHIRLVYNVFIFRSQHLAVSSQQTAGHGRQCGAARDRVPDWFALP